MRSIFEDLKDQRYLLWVVYPEDKRIRAAFATREAHYPRRSMLVVDVCGGSDMAEWAADATAVFRAYARDAGLDGVELYGRPGWARALKPYGWTDGIVLVEVSAAGGAES